MITKKHMVLVAGTAGIFGALVLINISGLTLRFPQKNNEIFCMIPVSAGDQFSLTYRHSVEKTRIKGIFEASQTLSILAVETRMTSVGTGLPNTFSKRTARQGKWIVVDEEKKEIRDFRFFISRVNAPCLDTPSGPIDLMALPSGTIVLFDIERFSLARFLFYWWKGVII